jgi:hypothetical protein
MMPWALAWSSQKSGPEDCLSSAAASFSLAAMSKMLHGLGDPGLELFEAVFQLLHLSSPSIT